ncbi:metallophosphoesterase, partial [Vibrio coralliirubri]
MKTYFISDLHLAPSRQDITDCFLTFMKNEAVEADALYVLGDLFEFWIGDDDKSEFATSIRQAFIDLVKTGVPCYFTQGNR